MLDIQFIRENPELVAEKSKQKGYDVDITQLLGFDKERRELQQQEWIRYDGAAEGTLVEGDSSRQ